MSFALIAQALSALTLVSGNVGVHLLEHGEVPLADAVQVADLVRTRIEARTGRHARLDSVDWSECTSGTSCADEIRARTGVDEVVMLKVFGGLTLIRVIAERSRPGAEPLVAQADLPAERSGWAGAIEALVGRLFVGDPRASPGLSSIAGPEPPGVAPPPGPRVLPWLVLGVAVGALGTGAGFGLSSAGAKDQLASGAKVDQELIDLTRRMDVHGTVANALILGGIGAAVAGLLLLLE